MLYSLFNALCPVNGGKLGFLCDIFSNDGMKVLLAIALSFGLWTIFGKFFIKFMRSIQQNHCTVREYLPENHFKKPWTPTMGGIFLVADVLLVSLVFCDLSSKYVVAMLILLIAYAAIGCIDDYLKIFVNNTKGMSGKLKFLIESLISLLFAFYITKTQSTSIAQNATCIFLPVWKNFACNLGVFYFIFAIFVVSGSANSVNLSDGIDGLAATLSIISCCFLLAVAAFVANQSVAAHFHLIFIEEASKTYPLIAATIGSTLGFYVYNKFPAKIYMGDTGSLALGAFIGGISLILKQEILLFISGFLFVIETMSVILQVLYYKKTKKRLFLMAPFHHHLEKKGWNERKIVTIFANIALLLSFLAFYIMIS